MGSSVEMVYNEKLQKWVPNTVASTDSTSSDTPSEQPKPATGSNTQTNSAGKANKEQAVLEYNTLEGDLTLRASVGVLKIKQDTTIQLDGVGSYLSGLYYVSSVSYTLDASSGFAVSCTLVKTGFGSSLKPQPKVPVVVAEPVPEVREEVVEKKPEPIKVKDKVRIVGDDAVYSNGHDGVKVPNWVKQKTLTVQQISKDGARALVQPIVSWTYIKYLEKV